ncbi:ABC transporter ATP-binding protein [Pseudomonas gingeri]|uniref:ABC transporter ATP-binding protein n=1 Tax=Pseudomonas gingeri TaxID=117681 RepID=A0A7Y7XI75_9PSED|nr:ABC transporter ATP-binding protein [Pseudomonas gingeri]NWC00359.1 ABC transporter ATP-binding protein [Pseudomonas gingeri]NWD69709.1 ABC transporter ATP-binding protein [Pseudomonas gingeri]NWD74711.1 ABC transporter ATP-binding protein [Pseudomonas gingeri]
MLKASHLSLRFGGLQVLDDVSLDIPVGRFTALIGANGCGKTTLLNVLARMQKPDAGSVSLAGKPHDDYSRRALARQLALLPQRTTSPAGMTVRELVMQGRFPWQGWWRQWSEQDQRAIDQAIALSDIHSLLDRSLSTLSGGQLQRCWIAMTLAQDTPVILLDEPTTFLDIAHQIALLELLVDLREQGRTIVAVLHDLNQAARYADHLVMMCKGNLLAQGNPREVFTAANLKQVFDLEAHIITDPHSGDLLCVPKSTRPRAVSAEGVS